MKTKIILGACLLLLGTVLVLFWRQALVEFSVWGSTISMPQTHEQVRQGFPTYWFACMLTGVDSLPPSGAYDAGAFCRTILRRLHPGLVLGYGVAVVGAWRLATAFLNPHFKRTHAVLNMLMLVLVAILVVDGVKTWVMGPRGTIRSFEEPASKAPHAVGAETAPQHER